MRGFAMLNVMLLSAPRTEGHFFYPKHSTHWDDYLGAGDTGRDYRTEQLDLPLQAVLVRRIGGTTPPRRKA
jgi:hypothetical protein